MIKRNVVLESPYGAQDRTTPPDDQRRQIMRNVRYARACARDAVLRGEASVASHLHYTQPGILNDANEDERALGIEAGFSWRPLADASVFYTDLGWSRGMLAGRVHAEQLAAATAGSMAAALRHVIEERSLGGDWEARAIALEIANGTTWPEVSP